MKRYVDVSTSNFCGLKIRYKVVLLTNKNIKLTSVDFVRFTWLEELAAIIRPVEQGKRHTTPPTIWIGVLPETLGADLAYESTQEILGLLKQYNIDGVDVAFRESIASSPLRPGHRPGPIAGLRTEMQGILGFYFGDKNDLYAVTARHVLSEDDEGNDEYRYKGTSELFFLSFPIDRDSDYTYIDGPRKEVAVMSPRLRRLRRFHPSEDWYAQRHGHLP